MSEQLPKGGLLLGVVSDFALRQRPLQLVNLSFGEGEIEFEIQHLQLREVLQTLHTGQLVIAEIQRL